MRTIEAIHADRRLWVRLRGSWR